MKKILIIGATSCLGRSLTNYLKSLNKYTIYKVSRNIVANNIDYSIDVSKEEQMKAVLQDLKPDIMYNLVGTYSQNFHEAYCINVDFTRILLEIALEYLPKTRVMLIGSAAEYGIVREDDNPIHEDFKLAPVTSYGLTKAFQSLLMQYYSAQGIDVVYSRIFNLYGDNMNVSLLPGAVYKQIEQYKNGEIFNIVTGDLSQYRDFISVEEASIILDKISQYGKAGEIYNIGSGLPISCRQLVMQLLKKHGLGEEVLLEKKTESTMHKVKIIYADLQKTKEIISL